MRCALVVLLALAISCAARPRGEGYRPVVDKYDPDFNQEAYDRDLRDCQQIASEEIKEGHEAAVGAAAGAAGGAILGGILAAGTGYGGQIAARGGAAGAVAGGTKKGVDAVRDQETIIRSCMEHRGHRLLL